LRSPAPSLGCRASYSRRRGSILGVLLWIIGVIVYLFLIFLTMGIARSKNRSPLGFGLFAVFLPLIALIVVLIISPVNSNTPQL